MTDSERKKIEQERIDRCNNCKYCIHSIEIITNNSIYCDCDCRKFIMRIEPRFIVSCKYFKQCKNSKKFSK